MLLHFFYDAEEFLAALVAHKGHAEAGCLYSPVVTYIYNTYEMDEEEIRATDFLYAFGGD